MKSKCRKLKEYFNKLTAKKLIRFVLQVLFLLIVFTGIQIYQNRNLLSTGTMAPTLKLMDFNGKEIIVDFHTGNKSILYMVAPWCGICKVNIGNLEMFRGKKNLNIYIVAIDYETTEDVKVFIAKNNVTLPVYLGNESIQSDYRVLGFPTIYFVNEKGHISHKTIGYTSTISLYLRYILFG